MRLRPEARFATVALLATTAGLAIPLLGLVPPGESSPFCGRDGRCCCETRTTPDESSCVRSACGCRTSDSGVVPAPLRLEATLASVSSQAPRAGSVSREPRAEPIPLAGTGEPPTPPPKPPLSA